MKNFLVWAILLGAVGYGGAKLYMHKEVADTMDDIVLTMSPYAKIEYEGVDSTLSGELTVEGVSIYIEGFRDELFIDRIGIDTPSFFSLLNLTDLSKLRSNGMPEYFGFLVEGVRIPANADYYADLYEFTLRARGVKDAPSPAEECVGQYGFSPKALNALGYSDQVLSMTMTLRDEQSLFSFDMDVSMEDMWDMNANVSFAGNMMAELSKGMGYEPKLRDMKVEFTDRSLKDRMNKYCEQLGLTPSETLRAHMDSFKYVGESNGIEFDQYMLDPYKEFILGKPTLVVTAKPNNPLQFSQIDLYKPSDVPALLNLAAVAR